MRKSLIQRSVTGLALCIILAFSGNACAWFDSGHMIIARIAYDNLTEEVQVRVNDLLLELEDVPPSYADFIRSATWMDGIKNTGLVFFDSLHYINQYYVTDGVSTVPAFENSNVVWAIQQASATLANPKSSVFAQALALRFLIHTVGDVHQPLHAVSLVSPEFPDGDLGGNRFSIQPTGSGHYNQLHALWDSGVLLFPDFNARSAQFAVSTADAAKQILQSVDMASLQRRIEITDPRVWADESFQIAIQVAYHDIRAGGQPSDAYIRAGQQAVAEQVVLAGYRLANLLNTLLSAK